jgi:anti-anti-sigma factor
MNFGKEFQEDIVIEKVNLKRATYKEAEEFRSIVQGDIEAGWQKIIVDMENCKFMDSSFLGVLIISLKKLQRTKGSLKLASIHNDARVLLDITRISDLFNIYPNKQEAIKSFCSN